jgi:hypothetical protein
MRSLGRLIAANIAKPKPARANVSESTYFCIVRTDSNKQALWGLDALMFSLLFPLGHNANDFLKLYLNPPGFSSIVLYGEENFPQAFTPDAQIFLKGWAVSQYFQYITRSHLWGLDSDL